MHKLGFNSHHPHVWAGIKSNSKLVKNSRPVMTRMVYLWLVLFNDINELNCYGVNITTLLISEVKEVPST